MTKIPSIKPKKLEKIAEKIGFVFDRQKGSHAVYYREQDHRRIVIPIHNQDMKLGTLRGIIADMGLSVEGFLELL